MTSAPSPAPNVGRLTGFVLGLVVFVCVTMVGVTCYLKYELDRAESTLTASDAALASDQDIFDKLRRALGYGGFIGAAQSFAVARDAAHLTEMKTQMKDAESILLQIPDKTSAEVRHDMQAIFATYATAMDKAEKAAADPAAVFAAADLVPLYATLPVLDDRVRGIIASNRRAAGEQAQFWGMLLTLVSWCSLIIAAALTAGIYLTIRDRNSAPLRALAQSVKNMAHGDMRTPIWGMERGDMIGELARAVDMARYQFSQMPDLTVLSDQGPVRLRFEGNTRSMFEAMMRVISRDSEQVHQQTSGLNESIAKQQETLALLVSRVEAVLQNVEKRAVSGDQQVRQALTGMLASAENLKNAQAHAADQLNRIVPYMQDRARGLSEIAQLTGKQVAQVLQSLILTERGLRDSAAEGEGAIKKLSSTADNLGERLFGAVNLLQASGKVLAETTEKTQSKLDEAILNLGKSLPPGAAPTAVEIPAFDAELAPRLENVASQLGALLAEQAQATRAQIDLLTTHSGGLATQTTTVAQTLSATTDRLREQQAKFDDAIGQFAGRLNDIGDRFERQAGASAEADQQASAAVQRQLTDISAQVADVSARIAALAAKEDTTPGEPAFVGALLQEIKDGFDVMGRSLMAAREQIGTLAAAEARATPSDASEQMRDQWYQMAAQIEATRSGLAQIIAQQVDRVEARLVGLAAAPEAPPDTILEAQRQIEQQTQILAELVTTLGVLDAHMQELRSQVAEIRRAG